MFHCFLFFSHCYNAYLFLYSKQTKNTRFKYTKKWGPDIWKMNEMPLEEKHLKQRNNKKEGEVKNRRRKKTKEEEEEEEEEEKGGGQQEGVEIYIPK